MEDVQTVIIPFIDGVVEIEQAIVATSTNQTAKDESSKKIVQLTEAKNGWQSLLDRNLKLYQDARAGKLKTGVTHLVAEALLQDNNGVDNVKYINGSQAPNADALRAISAIRSESEYANTAKIRALFTSLCSFGGVGAVIAYSESLEKGQDDALSTSTIDDLTTGVNSHASVRITKAGPTVDLLVETSSSRETSSSSGSSSVKAHTRSFALGDPDDGDYFDVQVR